MGLDRFINFISKSNINEGIEELHLNNNIKKVVSNHIVFDLNFILYQEIFEIENEINDIIKIILCLPLSINKNNILEEYIKKILLQPHWEKYNIYNKIYNIFNGNENDIINNFISFLYSKIDIYDNNLSYLELIIFEKINNTIINNIENIHNSNFIKSINLFYDGIPSYSKILEQRRRRVKKYIESYEKKKIIKSYFEKMDICIKNLADYLVTIKITNNYITFDYFKWLNSRFSIEKSFDTLLKNSKYLVDRLNLEKPCFSKGSASLFLKYLELFLNIRLNEHFPKINIVINSMTENGEADYKIFKYIANSKIEGDYSIHTTDSDLIHQVLVQQTYYKIINMDINFTIIRYTKHNNSIQMLDSSKIINNIMTLYCNINNIITNNYKIIWDLCLIFLFFGNDHVPSSIEIGPELGLEYFIKCHYIALGKNNIVNLKNVSITLDLNEFNKLLILFNENVELNRTKIILYRYFKINTMLINLFIDKLKLNFEQIQEYLKNFIIDKSKEININLQSNSLLEDDLRKKYLSNEKTYNYISKDIPTSNDIYSIIEDNIDYYEEQYNGLTLYSKSYNITKDSYQFLYNYISDSIYNNIITKYPDYNEHITINDHLEILNKMNQLHSNQQNSSLQSNLQSNNLHSNLQSNDLQSNDLQSKNSNTLVYDYLKKIFHLTTTQFGNMKYYHSDNMTIYKYNYLPSITSIIHFLQNNLHNKNSNYISNWINDINNDNVSKENYFNHVNHYIIITPFIGTYNITEDLKILINSFNNIDNLWLSNENLTTFKYSYIDIKSFFKKWKDNNIDNLHIDI
jgi:hypothetical protein